MRVTTSWEHKNIYGFLYGAGDAKIGEIVGGTAEHGAELRKKFLKATPAIKKLQQSVKNLLSTYNVEDTVFEGSGWPLTLYSVNPQCAESLATVGRGYRL